MRWDGNVLGDRTLFNHMSQPTIYGDLPLHTTRFTAYWQSGENSMTQRWNILEAHTTTKWMEKDMDIRLENLPIEESPRSAHQDPQEHHPSGRL